MTIYAYVRVSDITKQDSSTQCHTIEAYAKSQGFHIDHWRVFHMSGSKTTSKERGIDELKDELKEGDIVLVSDVARLGRDSIHAVLNTITSFTTKGVSLHFCYSKTTIEPQDANDVAKVFIAIGEAYAAVKFAEERSAKAKAACERRKASGLANGRKNGAKVKCKLDAHAVAIIGMLDSGLPKTRILKELEAMGVKVSRARLYTWIDDKLGSKGVKKKEKAEA
ncbi:recombinase family protein [Vibrio vulnificus]|nr:recombinase family protein [Vibrio vulnificus]